MPKSGSGRNRDGLHQHRSLATQSEGGSVALPLGKGVFNLQMQNRPTLPREASPWFSDSPPPPAASPQSFWNVPNHNTRGVMVVAGFIIILEQTSLSLKTTSFHWNLWFKKVPFFLADEENKHMHCQKLSSYDGIKG